MGRRRRWHPTTVLLPGKSHGRRSPVGCSPWGRSKSDRTERLHFHFSPSCMGEGNGNPLQYSCLENPRDGGAWWAAVYGVAQSWTRLKRLSSSSSSRDVGLIPGSGRSPWGGCGNPLQCSCLENPMDRGASWAKIRRVTKNHKGHNWSDLAWTHVEKLHTIRFQLLLLLSRFNRVQLYATP